MRLSTRNYDWQIFLKFPQLFICKVQVLIMTSPPDINSDNDTCSIVQEYIFNSNDTWNIKEYSRNICICCVTLKHGKAIKVIIDNALVERNDANEISGKTHSDAPSLR